MIELQTLWPFPEAMIREKCRAAKAVLVVEMNMGQVLHQVRAAVAEPERVFLVNRFDGMLITPTNIQQIIRVIQGRGM